MRVLHALVLVAACGGPSAPPATPIANRPTPPAAVVAATCAEAAVILRGAIDSDDKKAGPDKEVAIATTCTKTGWKPEVLTCLASEPAGDTCLAKLTEAQHGAYDEVITAWNTTYGEVAGEDDPPPPPPDDYIDCQDAIGSSAEGYAPIAAKDPDDRAFVIALRTKAMIAQCNMGWDVEARRCALHVKDGGAPSGCVAMLEASQQSELTAKLAELETLMTKIAAARKKPATIDCKKVVATHYGDAMWKDKLDGAKAADRKRAIDESRKRMTAACTAEKWTPTVRACVVVNGGEDCTTQSWRYPAGGVILPTGIPECDAYGAAIVKLANCPSLPKSAQESMLDSFSQMTAAMGTMPAESKKAMADACKQATGAIEQMCRP